ncbi:MAG: hypothetical protein AAB558_02570 [Patescibacteria group bacterium]
MATNEEEKGRQEVLGIDRLLKAREKALDTAKGDKLVRNFAEAMGLIAKLEQVTKLGGWALESAKGSASLGDSIIDLMQEVKGLVDKGENDEAKDLFEGTYQRIVDQAFSEGGALMQYSWGAADRYFGEQEVALAIDHLIPNGREFIELGKKAENKSDDMSYGFLIDLWIWAGKNEDLRKKVEQAITRVVRADKGEIETEMYDGNVDMEYERLRYNDFVDAGIMKKD